MVQLTALWLPILLAAVFVFIASSVIHMVLGYHKSDYRKVESEDGVMDALRKFDIPPGDYMVPNSCGPEGMKSPEFQEKMKRGPVAIFTIINGGRNIHRQESHSVVHLQHSGRRFCGVHQWPCARSSRALPRCLPLCGNRGVCRLQSRADAELDLGQSKLDRDFEIDV